MLPGGLRGHARQEAAERILQLQKKCCKMQPTYTSLAMQCRVIASITKPTFNRMLFVTTAGAQ